ncbi:DUF1553 domain-containing protein [Rhodopirellula sp. MGV]|uniref:DUF1553 domain-containing protein n=1 Tax=Rhodopirellula sp. MGV TaxID=2023130 RepID=UPI000B96A7E4|nr:DUF1553 domain-containing protein [Rhodopirellula sp. MGV]OYP37903.1 hypothetical protein CGZ80_04035 [Rhodopirellula sp. MGV]PNY37080.1 DUF1553 domain-containing protein [Rhodopirellula baltica]
MPAVLRWFSILWIGLWSHFLFAADPASVEFFETEIRPVLIEHCYECHNSSDADEGGFVADHRAAMRQGGETGAIMVPGDASQSRLIAILRHEIDGLEMPAGGPKLDEAVIAKFARWIDAGAMDPRDQPPSAEEHEKASSWPETMKRRKQWWSFQPFTNAQPPSGEAANPIDRFIDQTIRDQQLKPSPRANADVLVRRLYVTLIGLPPTIQQSQDWSKRIDESGDEAIAELIDSLLDNKHFGERWARHWMDWVRYAESHGSEGDPAIEGAWHYRDYLIRALNADVPYDQLVREHIAGDLLEQPRVNLDLGINESVIGTAHWRMVFHGFAPTDALDERVRFTDDQINVFSKTFLGLTVSCARCHDHKFDPISQADYYALFGILESCRPGRAAIQLPDVLYSAKPQIDQLKSQIKSSIAGQWIRSIESLGTRLKGNDFRDVTSGILAPLNAAKGKLDAGMAFDDAWQQVLAEQADTPDPLDSAHIHEYWNLGEPLGSDRWFGVKSDHEAGAGEFALQPDQTQVLTGIYPAGLYSHLHSQKFPSRFTSDDVVLGANQRIWVESIGDFGATNRYAVFDYPRNGTVYQKSELDPNWRWRPLDVSYWEGDTIHVEAATSRDAPLLTSGRDRSWFGLRRVVVADAEWTPPDPDRELQQAIFAAASQHPPSSIDDLVDVYCESLSAAVETWSSGEMSDAQALILNDALQRSLLENRLDHLHAAKTAVLAYRKIEASIPIAKRIPSLDESNPRDQPLMVRGNHKQLGEPVPRRFLEAIDPTPYAEQSKTTDSGRRQLAEDILRSDNPLARRVIVNRIWTYLFGKGLVTTPDNFGRLGAKPTHPELLDYLANEFSNDGWSIKTLIRRILLTDAWQRSSVAEPASIERDPANQYLTHANQRRLEAEAIRDHLLSIAGQLDGRMFGRPVNSTATRRSIYLSVIRNALDPFLRAFDFPEPFATVGDRSVTNVPAQSLTLMNDPVVDGWARQWAARQLRERSKHTDQDRIAEMFYQVTARQISGEELSDLTQFLEQTKQEVTSLLQKRDVLNQERLALSKDLDNDLQSAIELVTTERATQNKVDPIAAWDFTTGLQDRVGKLDATIQGDAHVDTNGLTVRRGAYAIAGPIPQTLRAKSLEAHVKLDSLEQSGGGVISIQTPDGRVFDAIVYGERQPRRWLSGSELHRRSQDVIAAPESLATERAVQIVITYHEDGNIAIYRNGQPYGQPYESTGPADFLAGQAMITFGLRHLPSIGNRSLQGQIVRAAIYDTALTAEQVAIIAKANPKYLSIDDLIEDLDPEQQVVIKEKQQRFDTIKSELQSLSTLQDDVELQAYTELARTMFLLKELIYVR